VTDQELKEIRDDLSLITEGKWFRYNDETSWVAAWDEENECDTPVCECHELEDAMFIEKAPEYVRRLLDEVERLRKEKETGINEVQLAERIMHEVTALDNYDTEEHNFLITFEDEEDALDWVQDLLRKAARIAIGVFEDELHRLRIKSIDSEIDELKKMNQTLEKMVKK
jgi:hypothetical protein